MDDADPVLCVLRYPRRQGKGWWSSCSLILGVLSPRFHASLLKFSFLRLSPRL